MFRILTRSAIPAVGLLVLAAATPAFGQGCKDLNAIASIQPSTDIDASFTITTVTNPNDTATYTITTPNNSPNMGVPGLIEYCIYPNQPPGNPDSASASYDAWKTQFAQVQGYFAFQRPGGNPTNLPFDGSTQTVGTATWAAGAPTNQVIALHINDPDECNAIYQDGSSTCFVLPQTVKPPPQACLGNYACKTVVIDEADETQPDTVPAFTLLHLHYTYTIFNPEPTDGSGRFMVFQVPTNKTQDINAGGGKDYFGCEQQPDPLGSPGTWGTFNPYESTAFKMDFQQGPGGGCPQSRFFLTDPGPGVITLAPGASVTFTVDMVTRTNKGGKREYTSCGSHLLNSGFTVKWFWGDKYGQNLSTLQSFSTNITPIYVNVVGCS